MFRYFLSAIALLYPLSIVAQQGPPPVATVRPSDPDWRSVVVSALDDQLIGVKKATNNFYFTPTPVVDWRSFDTSVANVCDGKSDTEIMPAEINLLYYHPLVLAEIAQKARIALNTLSVVPHFGHSVFLRDTDNKYHMITTLDITTLLEGEAMSASLPLPDTERLIVKRPCALLKDFSVSRSLKVAYHAQGQNFETASINAEVLMSQSIDTFFDTIDEQTKTDQTSINVSSGGSGLAIDIGPFSYNSAGTEQSVTKIRKFNRAINRNWLSERADDTLQTINIEEVCGLERGCLEDSSRQMIIEFALRGAEERRLDFKRRADGLYDIFVEQTSVGKAILNVDETLKATLNTIFANTSEEERSGEYAGVKATRKETDNNTLTINGNSEFTKNGEDWIPTSLTLHLVDTTRVQDRIRAGYARTILQDKVFVSYQAQDVSIENLPENFIRDGFYNLHETALSNLSAQSKAADRWKTYYRSTRAYLVRISSWGAASADFYIPCAEKDVFVASREVRRERGEEFCSEKGQIFRGITAKPRLRDPNSSCYTRHYILLCTGPL